MDSEILMESILLVDTINKYLNSTDEKFYYEKTLMDYKITLIKYIEEYFNTLLNDPDKLLGFLNKINNTVKDGLNNFGLFVNKYDSKDAMLSELIVLMSEQISESDFDEERIKFLFENSLNDYTHKDARLYSIYKILKYLNYFEEDQKTNENTRIIKKKRTNKNDD